MLLRPLFARIRTGKSNRRELNADFDAGSVKRAAHFTP
jgi:hypothetical protein